MSHWQQEDISKRYEAGERTVQPAALRVIELSGVLTASSPRIVLDNACGTGVVTALLHEKATWGETDRIVAGDFSESMVKGLKERIEGMKWLNTEAKVVDAQVRLTTPQVLSFNPARAGHQAAQLSLYSRPHQLWHHAPSQA